VVALITIGSLAQFSVEPTERAAAALPRADEVDNFGVLAEVTREAPAEVFRLAVSPEPRGLAVASLRLEKGFQNFLARVLHKTSDVYFLTWCWDMSGGPASLYPGSVADPAGALIPMKGGELREFIGAGAVLFPARPVTAGLAMRMQIWESAQGVRQFGQTMSAVAQTIQQSRLNSLLTLVATATGVATTTIALVEQAALELGRVIGDILKASSDDYVDFYEGYFPASQPWTDGQMAYKGHASEIVLNKFR
jgi:hypothetical protein